MRGIKGTAKQLGDPCAGCGAKLTAENSYKVKNYSSVVAKCRQCIRKREKVTRDQDLLKVSLRNRRYRAKVRDQVLAAYGRKCVCCGESTPEFLALDHVNGGGTKERKEFACNTSGGMYRRVRDLGFPASYQLLCHNCNCAKGWYGICPHQRH